jgi:RHS repeat-associated protein
VSTYSYFGNNQDRRLQQIAYHLGPATISAQTYTHNPIGQVTNWIQQAGSVASNACAFVYDAIERLTEGHVMQSGAPIHDFLYNYDSANNRTQEQIDAVSRTLSYNVINEITTSSLTSTNTATYEWDGEHRLSAINQGSRRTELSYDGKDRWVRIVEKDGGSTLSDRHYVWAGTELCEERDATGATVLRRFFTQGVQVLSGPNAGNYYYSFDHLGSVREMLDGGGSVRARYDYNPFGRRTRTAGDLDADFGFTGHFYHASSGLHLALYRAYDADLGRWLNRDPLEESQQLNLFSYAANDPVNRFDPLGLADICLAGSDKKLADVAKSQKADTGEILVVVHGSKKGSFIKQGKGKKLKQVDVKDLAQQIKELDKFKDSKSIRLMSCFTGTGKFPQELANATGKTVWAPTGRVRASSDGTSYIKDRAPGFDKDWRSFSPDVSLGPKQDVDISLP